MPHNPLGALPIKPLGEYIREQRRNAQYSVRQLAQVAGVSNPYLSQIERGLRKPSAEILQQIAKGLRISAEQLYVRAGFLEYREGNQELVAAILGDEELGERQKQVLLDIYESFRREGAQGWRCAGSRDRGSLAQRAAEARPARHLRSLPGRGHARLIGFRVPGTRPAVN
jgi:transcriptional regulator with XRE-family HTH domain